jgi:hypothetical protein
MIGTSGATDTRQAPDRCEAVTFAQASELSRIYRTRARQCLRFARIARYGGETRDLCRWIRCTQVLRAAALRWRDRATRVEVIRCGFCGVSSEHAELIVRGATGDICDACISICHAFCQRRFDRDAEWERLRSFAP